MVRDFNLKEEVYKCSKCGQCKSVCPVYLAVKNEMFLSRGRYILLNSIFNNSQKLSKDFINKLDVCLNCNVCKDFCPSGIDAYKIFTQLKNDYGYKYSIVPFSFIYKIFLLSMRMLSIIYKYIPLKSLFVGTFFDKIFDVKVKRQKNNKIDLNKGAVVYFEGCVNKYINPSDKNSSLNLIEKAGYSIKKVVSLCCGYPYLNEGNFGKFKSNAQKVIKSIPSDVKYIICSCDSCYDTLLKYQETADADDDFTSKLITLDKFMEKENYKINSNANAMYFKPLLRKEDCYLPEDVKILNKKGVCSTFENFFALKYRKYANEIIMKQFFDNSEIDDQIIVTTCRLSQLGLINSVRKKKSSADVMSYSEYIFKNN